MRFRLRHSRFAKVERRLPKLADPLLGLVYRKRAGIVVALTKAA